MQMARWAFALVVMAATLGCAGRSAPSGPAASEAAPAAAAAPASTAAGPAAAEHETIQYGYNPILAGGPMYLAQDRGYFAEQGLSVEFTPFDSGALMIAPASAGQLDVIAAVPSPSLFNALVRNVDLRAIAAQSWSTTTLLLRKDLADSGQVKTLQDLKGKRVSFNVEGSPVDYQLRKVFLSQGMTLQDLDVVRLANTDLAAALANGAVEAGVASDPLPVMIEQRGIGVRFVNSGDVIGPQPSGLLVVGPGMASRGDATATRFLVAFLHGLRDELGAIHEHKITDPDVLAILSKWTKVPAATIGEVDTPGADPSGRIDLANMKEQQEFWVQEGQVPTRADLDRFVDYKYLDAALAQSP